MKKSLTLIELLVTITIVGILVSVAIPVYNKQVLKGKFEEAKVTIQKIALAQERYKNNIGNYFPQSTNVEILNENIISLNLSVDLKKSNNFSYSVENNGTVYKIIATLRDDKISNCDNNDNDPTTNCKQTGTIKIDDWVYSYSRSSSNHKIVFQYPNGNFNYDDIYKGD